MIQPNELAFYQADAKDPWSYLWVGFAGSRAEEYLHSMGLSDRHPIFSCDKSEELYSIVRDMMEHNTFGIADDLRRNGLLGVFQMCIRDSLEFRQLFYKSFLVYGGTVRGDFQRH